jgi:hypothetical protein
MDVDVLQIQMWREVNQTYEWKMRRVEINETDELSVALVGCTWGNSITKITGSNWRSGAKL